MLLNKIQRIFPRFQTWKWQI